MSFKLNPFTGQLDAIDMNIYVPEYENDPVDSIPGDLWVTDGLSIGEPIGLLLCLTNASLGPYNLSFKTLTGNIVRVKMT